MKRPQTHVSNYMNTFFNQLPDEQKKRALIDRKIKQVYAQFAACVDEFILCLLYTSISRASSSERPV